jgi:hypothetical protein
MGAKLRIISVFATASNRNEPNMNHETSMSFGHFRVPLQQLTLEKWEKRKKYTTFVLSIGEKTD